MRSRKSLSLSDAVLFFKAFLKDPCHVGAVYPSSPFLADAMTSFDDFKRCSAIVELGCGTGAITEVILKKMPTNARYFGVELNSECIALLRSRFPNVCFFHASAEHLKKYLDDQQINQVDAIISGLPWATLPVDMQDTIFKQIINSLTPKGTFVTFAYAHAKIMPRAIKFKRKLQRSFKKVIIAKTVWRNFPPAFFYVCTEPIKN